MICNASSPPVSIGRKLHPKSSVKQFESQETHTPKSSITQELPYMMNNIQPLNARGTTNKKIQ
jgi:hypothetical protein